MLHSFNEFRVINHRESKEWTGNAVKLDTTVRDTLYFEPCNFTLNRFQEFVFTTRTEMWMQLLTFLGVNKAENHH